jgi:hypothetical protein
MAFSFFSDFGAVKLRGKWGFCFQRKGREKNIS